MPYVPGFQYDVFISYASENNRDSWVKFFYDVLTDELEQLLGRQFLSKYVFFDKTKLRVGQSFPKMLETGAEASALLIPILSPSYLTSDWCDRERRAFYRLQPEAVPAKCLAPVLVRPIDEASLIEPFRDAQRFSFLQPGQQEPWPAGSPRFTSEVKKLAAQLKLTLQQLRQKCKPVFLGRALPGLEKVRSDFVDELQRWNFRVGPEALWVFDDPKQLTVALQEAILSVHFIGGADEWALRAIEIAAEVGGGATILYRPYEARVSGQEEIWLPVFERSPKLKAEGRYQRIEGKNNQELLSVLEQEITRIRPPVFRGAKDAEIGMICDESDLELARLLQHEIEQRDQLLVACPDFLESRSTPMERTRKYTELLNTCKALLFCWGQTKEATLLESIHRLAASGKAGVLLEWYLAQPDLNHKLQMHPKAICQAGEFSYDALSHFLEPFRRREPAAQ
jgi:hypothetical protein